MTNTNIITAVLTNPLVAGIKTIDAGQKRDAVAALFSVALAEVTTAYDWDFAVDEGTTSTVADQADYTLEGNNSDCRDIINVKIGTDLLTKMRKVAWDEYIYHRSHTGVTIWIPAERVDGFPTITIIAAPSSADDTITYRYRKTAVGLSSMPDDFAGLIISALTKRLIPDYEQVYRIDLRNTIKRYSFGGGESDRIKQDPRTVVRNNRRANLMGY